MLNVKVCVPCAKRNDEGTLSILFSKIDVYNKSTTKKYDFSFENCFRSGPYVDVNRELLVCEHNNNIKPEIPHWIDIWLFLDNDMVPNLSQVLTILDNLKPGYIDICGALYQTNSPDSTWNCSNQNPKGVIPVYLLGTGLMAFTRTYFEEVPRPWFPRSVIRVSSSKIIVDSEDFGMCRKAAKYGIPVYVDGSVKVPHKLRDPNWRRLV